MTAAVKPGNTETRPLFPHHLRIPLLAAFMAVLAALIAAPGLIKDPGASVPSLEWLVLLPLFALAEIVVIHLPTQRNAHGHTLREIPAVLGLAFLAPQQYLTAYVVGAVLALIFAARMRGVKLAFNASMFALEASLGALTYHAILQGNDPLSMTGWVAVLVAVLVTDLISAGAVTTAISLTEGVFDGEVLHEALVSGSVAAFINTCVALLITTLVMVQPSALPLLAVIVILLVVAHRAYISLARGHARTHLLYRFVDRTSSAHSLEEVIEVVVKEAAELMHAERAYLVEVVDEAHVRYHSFGDDSPQAEPVARDPDAWWWGALDAGVVQHEVTRSDDAESGEAVDGGVGPALLSSPRDGLAAPLRGAGSVRYVLVVADRSFEKETFDDEDRQVFEALAAHAGVSVGRARGVSDLKSLAKELEAARDAALAASRAKSMFLANMSHEIRTPLTTVLAAAELLQDTSLDQGQANLIDRMHRSGEQLLALVENVLDFSRIEAGHSPLHSSEFDLPILLADIVDAHLPGARERGITLAWSVDPRVPRCVVGDRTRVIQVLNNLLTNALKFTSIGRVDLDVTIGLDPDRSVQFSVSDTGIGIDQNHQQSIFEVFSQADGSITRHYAGTGLGLAICKQLTELMGGTITVAGQLGVGSTFTVRLPLPTAETVRATQG
ncbi:hypothetical protein GCM10027020_21500 [Nocardioides salsibiostraticola]